MRPIPVKYVDGRSGLCIALHGTNALIVPKDGGLPFWANATSVDFPSTEDHDYLGVRPDDTVLRK